MKKFAIVENGVVVNSAIAHAPIAPNWIESDAGIGWIDNNGTLEPPPIPVKSRREEIQARLIEIDAISDKPRTRRELALSRAATKTWLQTLDDEASTLRAKLAALP